MKPLRAADPAVVGEFRLRGRLGSGGMGDVYLGTTRSGRPVAVKVIRAGIAAEPAFRARFVREVEAARRVGGFWTASVVAADPDAESPWLATEYVPGPSLQDAVAEAGPLPAAAVRVVGARLAEALAAIHDAGLVHRDLKPANVLMGPAGPVVIDFGIARAFATDSAMLTSVIGTPGYMSPEQIRGDPLSPASDVFSFGGTLVFAVTGRGPFHTGAPEGIVFRVVTEEADLTGVPADLRPLLAGCLAKDPARRPGTDALLAELGPAAVGLTTPYGDWHPPGGDPPAGAAPPEPPGAGPGGAPEHGTTRVTGPMPTQPVTTVYSGVRIGEPGRQVTRHLVPGERYRAQWRPHPVQLAPSIGAAAGAALLLALLCAFAIGYLDAGWFATVPVVMGVGVAAWLLWRVVEWRGSRLVLSDQRILMLAGGGAAAVPLAAVTDVSYRQPAAGRLLGYGAIVLRLSGTGTSVREVRCVPEVAEVHRVVTETWRRAR